MNNYRNIFHIHFQYNYITTSKKFIATRYSNLDAHCMKRLKWVRDTHEIAVITLIRAAHQRDCQSYFINTVVIVNCEIDF